MKSTVKEMVEREVLEMLPENLAATLKLIPENKWEEIFEIRIRAGKNVALSTESGEKKLAEVLNLNFDSCIVTQEDILKTIGIMSQNSVYAVQDEIKAGFITLRGGHRVGLAGKVISEDGKVQNIKQFSSINIRIAREIKGSADKLLEYLIQNGTFKNTLIVSPPRCGKTTILRDSIRQLSNGIPRLRFKGTTIGVVDERSEIAACFKGLAQNDIGVRTDVYDSCPKSQGIIMMVRAMSPGIIATDEIGSSEDAKAIMTAITAGIKVLTTSHGNCLDEIFLRAGIKELLDSGIFERIVFLNNKAGPGTISVIYDQSFNKIYDYAQNISESEFRTSNLLLKLEDKRQAGGER